MLTIHANPNRDRQDTTATKPFWDLLTAAFLLGRHSDPAVNDDYAQITARWAAVEKNGPDADPWTRVSRLLVDRDTTHLINGYNLGQEAQTARLNAATVSPT